MDKETLSNYGWIVIAVLVLAIMIALATPFGSYVSGAVKSTTEGLFDTNQTALSAVGIGVGDQNFSGDAITRNNIIPTGGTYKVKTINKTLSDGNKLPTTPATGDTYEEGDYKYIYNRGDSYGTEWSVEVKDKTKTSYGEILSEIAGKSVNNLYQTFEFCDLLTVAPKIPNSITNMEYTFKSCSALKCAPELPNGVKILKGTFGACEELCYYVGNTNANGDFSGYKISNEAINTEAMFLGCKKIKIAPAIPNNVTNAICMFGGCSSLTVAPIIPNSVTNISTIFESCASLKTYAGSTDSDGNFAKYIIPNSTIDISFAFQDCTSLTTTPSIPESVENMTSTFFGCTSLTGSLECNTNPTSYTNCLKNTQITSITGSCSQEIKDALLATK